MIQNDLFKSTEKFFNFGLFSFLKLIPCALIALPLNSLGYIEIEPPILPDTSTTENPSGQSITFSTVAKVYSDVRWRGLSLTSSRPGLLSNTEIAINHGRFITSIGLNGFSYSMDPPASQQTNSLTDDAYLMTESRIGTKIIVGDAQTSDMYLMLSRSIYIWPGGTSWKYVQETCTAGGTTDTYITKTQKINPVKTNDVMLYWGGLSLSYSISDLKNISTSDAPNRQLWEDYFAVRSSQYQVTQHYSVDLDYGYAKNTGRHIDFNINYHFSKDTVGTLKCFNFKSYSPTFEDQNGFVGILRYTLA